MCRGYVNTRPDSVRAPEKEGGGAREIDDLFLLWVSGSSTSSRKSYATLLVAQSPASVAHRASRPQPAACVEDWNPAVALVAVCGLQRGRVALPAGWWRGWRAGRPAACWRLDAISWHNLIGPRGKSAPARQQAVPRYLAGARAVATTASWQGGLGPLRRLAGGQSRAQPCSAGSST